MTSHTSSIEALFKEEGNIMATTGRYSDTAGSTAAAAAASGAPKSNTTTTSGGTSTTSPTSTTTNTTGNSVKDISSSTNTQNMTPSQLAALNTLIAQLASGGTANQKQDRGIRIGEIAGLQQQRQGYSKEAALADAQGLMAQQQRLALEKLMPSINSASLGAGASASSMRALLTQRAASVASENASAAGLNAAVNYGQVSNGMSSVLANLIAQQDPVAMALVNALSVAKGSVANSKTTGTETTNSTGTQNTSTSGGTVTTSPTTSSQVFAPMGSPSPLAAPSNSFYSVGPQQTAQSIALDNLKYTGSTADTLSQLSGSNSNYFSNYRF
jgi:hypothetical protein